MPLDIIPANLFPDVPAFPGVPQLARVPAFLAVQAQTVSGVVSMSSTNVTMSASNLTVSFVGSLENAAIASISRAMWQSAQSAPQWGVLDKDGNIAIDADSVITFEHAADYRVTSAPVEQGQFASYNKVANPNQASVVLVKGGSLDDRTNFLKQIDTVLASLDLYSILTPEHTYPSINAVRREITRREQKGAYFLEVELFFEEIREQVLQYSASVASTANAQQPSALPATNIGNAQPTAPTAALTQGVQDAQNSTDLPGITVEADRIPPTVLGVPLTDSPAQNLATVLGGQGVQIGLSLKNNRLYFGMTADGVSITNTRACLDRTPLLLGAEYLGFKGNFTFVDTQGGNHPQEPAIAGLGTRFQLAYYQ